MIKALVTIQSSTGETFKYIETAKNGFQASQAAMKSHCEKESCTARDAQVIGDTYAEILAWIH